jgi:soluble lytic murein transglycosylase
MRFLLALGAGLTLLGAPALAVPAREAREAAVKFDRRWLEPHFASGALAAAAERFRRGDNSRALEGFARGIRGLPARDPTRLAAQYVMATAHMEREDWSAAGALFEELYTRYPVLAPYHAHYAARCRLRRGDSAGALQWAERVPDDSVLRAETVLIELDALAALGRWAEVETRAGKFLETYPNGPRRAEAMFQRAEAMENLQRPAPGIAELYRRIWAEAPMDSWSRRAEERLAALVARQPAASPGSEKVPGKGTAGPEDLRRFSAEEWLTRSMILFDRNQNEQAEAGFAQALAAMAGGAPAASAPGLAELRCKAEYHRAQSVFKQKNRTRAAPLFALAHTACKQAGNGDLTVKSLYQGGRCYHNLGDDEKAVALYAAVEKEGPQHSYADDARLRAAEVLTSAEQLDKAAALLASLPESYPQGDQLGEALWRLALAAIREQRWDEAHRWLDENLRRIPREQIWYAEGRALYWKGRVFVEQGAKDKALPEYTRAVKEYPLSVYAFLALERMRTEFPAARRELVRKLRVAVGAGRSGSKGPWQFAPRPLFGTAPWKRAVELARLGFGSDARRELARLGFAAPDARDSARARSATAGQNGKTAESTDDREDVYWITSVLLDRGRSWAAAHAIPRYTLNDFRTSYPEGLLAAKWRLAYPRAFPELVGPASKANRVPEALQLAIMREESAFNPRIESVANALGLTQMLVKTARRFSDGKPVTRDTLLDAGRNVELGSRFLSFLLDRYGGLAPLTIASYNAGEGAVDRWLGERGEMELDEFLETIPYDETRNYTKRVLSSYLTYAWLYDAERPVPELRFSLKPPRHERVGRPAGRTIRRPR